MTTDEELRLVRRGLKEQVQLARKLGQQNEAAAVQVERLMHLLRDARRHLTCNYETKCCGPTVEAVDRALREGV